MTRCASPLRRRLTAVHRQFYKRCPLAHWPAVPGLYRPFQFACPWSAHRSRRLGCMANVPGRHGETLMSAYSIELLGIAVALGLLILLAFRGCTLLLAAPAAAIVAAAASGEPILAKWTLTFMQGMGGFIISFFPLFLLGGVFGKLMDDTGAALSIARTITGRLGGKR